MGQLIVYFFYKLRTFSSLRTYRSVYCKGDVDHLITTQQCLENIGVFLTGVGP